MEALAEIVTTVDRLQNDITGLLSTLVQFGLLDSGRDLQQGLDRLLGVIRARFNEVWSPGLESGSSQNTGQVIVDCCQ